MSDSREMIEIKIGLWNVSRHIDTASPDDGTFEKAIAMLHELWERYRNELKKGAV